MIVLPGFLSLTQTLKFLLISRYLIKLSSSSERSKAMLTELCLASDEFDHFVVKAHNSFTFCLKELRVRFLISQVNVTKSANCGYGFILYVMPPVFQGLLVFAESNNLPVSMYFKEPGW